jgi:glutamate dehydrogenase
VADVVRISDDTGRRLEDAARAYYAVMARFQLGRIEALAQAVETSDYYESLAVEKARDTLAAAHRALATSVLTRAGGAPDLAGWEEAYGRRVADTVRQVEAILLDGRASAAKATVAAGLLAELANQRGPADARSLQASAA